MGLPVVKGAATRKERGGLSTWRAGGSMVSGLENVVLCKEVHVLGIVQALTSL